MIKPSFSGHETFALRHGWLEKAFFAVSNNPNNPFTQQNAISEFGVGKNMVNAIKHWSLATGFIELIDDKLFVSAYSKNLIEEGRDPFLESFDTLWKIHYELVKNCVSVVADIYSSNPASSGGGKGFLPQIK